MVTMTLEEKERYLRGKGKLKTPACGGNTFRSKKSGKETYWKRGELYIEFINRCMELVEKENKDW